MLNNKIRVFVILSFLIFGCNNEKDFSSKQNSNSLIHSAKVDTVKLKPSIEEKQPTEDEEYNYKKAHKLWYNEKTYQAISELQKFIKKHPKSSLADDAQKLIGTSYSNIFEFSKSKSAYLKVLKEYPNSNSSSLALYDLAHLHFYELKDFTNAKKYYEQFLVAATEDDLKWYNIAKDKIINWSNEIKNQKEFENSTEEKKIIDQKENPMKYLELIEDVWLDDEYRNGYLYVTVNNHSSIDYKDIGIKLSYYSETWSFLSSEEVIIYKIFPKEKTKKIERYEVGYAPRNAEYGISSIISAKQY